MMVTIYNYLKNKGYSPKISFDKVAVRFGAYPKNVMICIHDIQRNGEKYIHTGNYVYSISATDWLKLSVIGMMNEESSTWQEAVKKAIEFAETVGIYPSFQQEILDL